MEKYEKTKQFYRDSSIGISDTRLQSLNKCKKKYRLCCFYINLKIECEIIAI